MTKDEVLKLALEALHKGKVACEWGQAHDHVQQIVQAMEAIKEALAQPEPMQVTIKDFVAVVEGKEDWVGKPVYWAQWPNKETL